MYNLSKAKIVVLAGYFTGGVAALTYSNFLYDMLPSKIKMYTLIDSGLFFDPSLNTDKESNFIYRLRNFNHIMSKNFFNFCMDTYVPKQKTDGEPDIES